MDIVAAIILQRKGKCEFAATGGLSVLTVENRCGKPLFVDCLRLCDSGLRTLPDLSTAIFVIRAKSLPARQFRAHYARKNSAF